MENGKGIFQISDKNLFEWTDLIGKTLTIGASTDNGVTIVYGKGDDGMVYILAEKIEEDYITVNCPVCGEKHKVKNLRNGYGLCENKNQEFKINLDIQIMT